MPLQAAKFIQVVRDLAFNVTLAKRHGVNGAVMLHHLAFWVYRNKCNDRNFHDDEYWTYNSQRAYADLFPMWNIPQIKRILAKLENEGAIRVGNFNKAKFDRTNWYTITDEVWKVYQAEKDYKPSTVQNRTKEGTKSDELYQVTTQVTKPIDYTDDELDEVLPDSSCIEVWRNYVQHRKELKKKMTPLAYKSALKKAVGWAKGDPNIFKEICNNSISNGWTGLFDIKDKKRGFDPTKFKIDELRDWASKG